jgi:hypothetical protein|tara:strand:+ start:233 stop:547 length:315 start_codon:yes stop_codon:yes gene_type:complete
MASIISANLDLTKIDKSKIYEGKKGKYYPVTIVINDEVGQFGDSGYVQTEQTKAEREAKAPKSFLGNCKIMWTNGQNVAVTPKEGQPQPQPNTGILDDGPDLPF